jgi:hypothetical protein
VWATATRVGFHGSRGLREVDVHVPPDLPGLLSGPVEGRLQRQHDFYWVLFDGDRRSSSTATTVRTTSCSAATKGYSHVQSSTTWPPQLPPRKLVCNSSSLQRPSPRSSPYRQVGPKRRCRRPRAREAGVAGAPIAVERATEPRSQRDAGPSTGLLAIVDPGAADPGKVGVRTRKRRARPDGFELFKNAPVGTRRPSAPFPVAELRRRTSPDLGSTRVRVAAP